MVEIGYVSISLPSNPTKYCSHIILEVSLPGSDFGLCIITASPPKAVYNQLNLLQYQYEINTKSRHSCLSNVNFIIIR
jgi:hypothetical protein